MPPDNRRRGLRALTHYYDLLAELVVREMKVRYKRSALGIAWSLLNPLAQLLVLHFVFQYVLPLNIQNYTLFLFIGVLAWNWFQQSLQLAAGVITENPPLIRQPGFPAAILPVVTVTAQLLHFALALPVLLLFLAWQQVPLTWAATTLPLVIAVQYAVTLCLAYLLASTQVRFRDTQYLVGIALMLGFYLSPVFYQASAVPDRFQPWYRLNPLVHIIGGYREILIEGRIPHIL
ncbi:MAG: ABC transporter permease, partial [Bryobacteraceae bacterium]|nr:ABC transporter permease [Bryobacteraceae bacterium]